MHCHVTYGATMHLIYSSNLNWTFNFPSPCEKPGKLIIKAKVWRELKLYFIQCATIDFRLIKNPLFKKKRKRAPSTRKQETVKTLLN